MFQDNENFVEDRFQIEPFNLDKEREEGYFDAAGNFVEYVNAKEVKVKHYFRVHSFNKFRVRFVDGVVVDFMQDAWLDSVAIDPRYAE